MKISEHLKIGKENALSREYLCTVRGLSDRALRNSIEQERSAGTIICNEQNGNGYYLPANTEEIKSQFIQNKNRAMSILVQQKHLYAKLKEAGENVKWGIEE